MKQLSLSAFVLCLLTIDAPARVLTGNYPPLNDELRLFNASPLRSKLFGFSNQIGVKTLQTLKVRVELDQNAFRERNFPVLRLHHPLTQGSILAGPAIATFRHRSPQYHVGVIDYYFDIEGGFDFQEGQTFRLSMAGSNSAPGLSFMASNPRVFYFGETNVLGNVFTDDGVNFTFSQINQTWEIRVIDRSRFRQRMSGNVRLEDHSTGGAGQPVNLEFINQAGNTVHRAFDVLLRSDGSFETNADLSFGTYSVRVTARNWLSKSVGEIVVSATGITALDVQLANGDVSGDNEVGPLDFSLLAQSFGTSPGDEAFSDAADLDDNGEVGPSDVAILAANFGEFGD